MEKIFICLLIVVLVGCHPKSGKDCQNALPEKALEFLTSKASGERLKLHDTLSFQNLPQPEEHFPAIIIDPSKEFQTFLGIGGALTDAAAETFYKLPLAKQHEVLEAYYNSEKGIGYTLGRTNINSCDFSSDMYTYVDENDSSLRSFNLKHDLKYKIPFIKDVLKTVDRPFNLYASPWSPPAWMKTNNDMLHGGKLKPECHKIWAKYMVQFVKEYEKNGIPIWGMTVQNEPMAVQIWESCIYTADEEKDFVKEYLGPVMWKAGLRKVKLIIWDHNRGLMYQRAKAAYDDPKASKYIWGLGFHWYVGDHFENVGMLHDAYPKKHLMLTEGCVGPFDWKTIDDWTHGETYGRSMIHDFNNWAEAWTDWNVLLDETGGPNHVQNFCFAPIIADTRDSSLHYMNSYYYIGHFSKFLKPGARRILATSTSDDLLATAFKNEDGKIVVVVMNEKDKDSEYAVWLNNRAVKSKIPAHSIITVLF